MSIGYFVVSLSLMYLVIDIDICYRVYSKEGNSNRFKLAVFLTILILIMFIYGVGVLLTQ
ncbi:hypothetical protein BH792_gp129 [Staphylococcus phage Stau2]|uniref:Uncharacterized protein n=2 Tax=Silviavirus TaxID=1857889 RepID=A0A0U1ZY50_9CAUD|nr:hypothetical protein BH792_gp129 [Staphylococcus phage Stau2]AKA61379.1 hypothetical protein Stau2_128 [Staphylococcus phage Stau2]